MILENGELEHYAELLEEFTREMEACSCGRPGEALSIARGIAIYDSDTDLVFANVFKRADDAMYQNKAAMKERMAQNARQPSARCV